MAKFVGKVIPKRWLLEDFLNLLSVTIYKKEKINAGKGVLRGDGIQMTLSEHVRPEREPTTAAWTKQYEQDNHSRTRTEKSTI